METERKIVAIGGGEGNATLPIAREIVRLAQTEQPRFLFLGHARRTPDGEAEKNAFLKVSQLFGDTLGCACRQLLADDAERSSEAAAEALAWADIVYECGGNTVDMLAFWRQTGLDRLLRGAWEDGKVMCGSSAGAICWFACGNTDHPAFVHRPVNSVRGLGLIPAYFAPHCEKPGRRESVNRTISGIGGVALSVTDDCALEIVGDGFRVIPGDCEGVFARKTCRVGGTLRETELEVTADFLPLAALLEVR